MKHLFFKLIAPFRKPQLTGYLVKQGKGVGAKVRISKVSLEQCIIILYALVKRMAEVFKIDQRYIMHKVLDLDTAVKKDKKREEKEVRQQIYRNKK